MSKTMKSNTKINDLDSANDRLVQAERGVGCGVRSPELEGQGCTTPTGGVSNGRSTQSKLTSILIQGLL